MSGELLRSEKYNMKGPGDYKDIQINRHGEVKAGPRHEAVHDLESFFWVLLWLCLSRAGAGTRRSELLDMQNISERVQRLQNDFFELFEDYRPASLGNSKKILWTGSNAMLVRLLQSFTPFCAPLQDLVGKFYITLMDAFIDRNFEGLHDNVLKCFDDAEAILRRNTAPVVQQNQGAARETGERAQDDDIRDIHLKEQRRRKQDLADWDWDSPKIVKQHPPDREMGPSDQAHPTPLLVPRYAMEAQVTPTRPKRPRIEGGGLKPRRAGQ